MRFFIKCGFMFTFLFLCLGFCWHSSHMTIKADQERDSSEISPEQLDRAKKLFGDRCARCHGADGRGQTVIGEMLDTPDLTNDKWCSDDVTDERLTKSITDGKGEMPAFGKRFTKQEIAALVAYVRRLNKSKN